MSIAEFACVHDFPEAEITLGRWYLKVRFTWKETDDAELTVSALNHEYIHAILEEYHGCIVSRQYDNLALEVSGVGFYDMFNIGTIEVG